MFEVNHDDVFEGNGLMKEGEYEIIIKSAGENNTPNGTIFFQVDAVVRNDVDQQYKNKHIFHPIWKGKESGNYNMTNFNTICKALKIPQGTKFANLDELAEVLRNKVARVTVKHNTYNDKTNEKIIAWHETKFEAVNHKYKEKTDAPSVNAQVADDKLPF